jgi:hypothetical protein
VKRFPITPATALALSFAFFLLAIFVAPPVRFVFGDLIWDRLVLRVYETLRLFRVWVLFFALTVFVLAVYFFSRDAFWRYVFNRITIEMVAISLKIPGWSMVYAHSHRFTAQWYPIIYWNILNTLPRAFVSQDAQVRLNTLCNARNYMPPNHRFLAALRAQMDVDLRTWERELLTVRANARLNVLTMRRLISALEQWQEHFLVDQPSQRLIPETVYSGLIIAVEWMAVCVFHLWITRQDAQPLRDYLDQQIRKLSLWLPVSIGGASREHYAAVAQLASNHTVRCVLDSVTTYQNLLACFQSAAPDQSRQARMWTRVLLWQQMVLHAQTLVTLGYFQEALQIYFEADSRIGQFVPQPPIDETSGLLLRDVAVADPFWMVTLTLSSQEGWLNVVLSEAWRGLGASLHTLFPVSGTEVSAAQREANLPTRVRAVRQGYSDYADSETQSAVAAAQHLVLKEISESFASGALGNLPT